VHPLANAIVAIAWTVTVPVIMLVLAFYAPRLETSYKLKLAGLLIWSWLISSVAMSLEDRDRLIWDQGLLTILAATVGIWIAIHRMITELDSRYRRLLFLATGLVFGAFLLVMVGLSGFGSSHHY
jgi:hypothetical protein